MLPTDAQPAAMNGDARISFGQHELDPREFFYESASSRGLVNTKPIVPGHVLVIPKRVVAKFADLTDDEVADLWTSARRIGAALQRELGAPACTYAIQDGKEAGQTVLHVHVHVVPRRPGDFEQNDDVYGKLNAEAAMVRAAELMYAEADHYRSLFRGASGV